MYRPKVVGWSYCLVVERGANKSSPPEFNMLRISHMILKIKSWTRFLICYIMLRHVSALAVGHLQGARQVFF